MDTVRINTRNLIYYLLVSLNGTLKKFLCGLSYLKKKINKILVTQSLKKQKLNIKK